MTGSWREFLLPEGAVWLALVALLGLTLAMAFMPLGSAGTVANIAIAATKALLVAVFFMHLRHAIAVVRLASILGLLWLGLLLALTVADRLTR